MASAYRGFLVGGVTAQYISSDLAFDDKVITQPKLSRCLRIEDSGWVDKLFVVSLTHEIMIASIRTNASPIFIKVVLTFRQSFIFRSVSSPGGVFDEQFCSSHRSCLPLNK